MAVGHPAPGEATIDILLRIAAVLAIPVAIVIGWRLGAPPEKAELQAVSVVSPEPAAPPTLTIKTTRRGRHHIMRATLVGRGSKSLVVPLLVDTGASTMALPASMLPKLGYDPADLEDWLVETANGRIQVKKARLAAVEIGGVEGRDRILNVDAVFIPDAALSHPLMGMNVLGRYRMTIDDDRSQIILVKKP